MAVNDRRLTGRDVLNKTFQARTKRGYDPVEVDAYLELIAAQVDMLHGDVAAAEKQTPVSAEAEAPAESAELIAERDALASSLAKLTSELELAKSENEQLREQAAAVAPPPPSEEQGARPAHAATSDTARAEADDRASEESYELVLRMARRSAEETISEAHARADEIVADANFTAAQISRESDRKAFEAATKAQANLSEVHEEIDQRRFELSEIEGRAIEKRQELRDLANRILLLADEGETSVHEDTINLKDAEDAEVVDLRPQSSETS